MSRNVAELQAGWHQDVRTQVMAANLGDVTFAIDDDTVVLSGAAVDLGAVERLSQQLEQLSWVRLVLNQVAQTEPPAPPAAPTLWVETGATTLQVSTFRAVDRGLRIGDRLDAAALTRAIHGATLTFSPGSTRLDAASLEWLAVITEGLRAHADIRLAIVAWSDEPGGWDLSRQRLLAVRCHLVDHGVVRPRIDLMSDAAGVRRAPSDLVAFGPDGTRGVTLLVSHGAR